ncbi:hypothetical protein [Novosphingobium sp.]|uniref:hypothetical protein n=1 Tax=Novosphingobium sp. TaxID=1874826 RepID=UPI003B52761F
MIGISSIASALGLNPLDALTSAVRQAGATANPSAAAAAQSAAQTAAAAAGTVTPHAHHRHHGAGEASPAGAFVGTLETALASLSASERSSAAGTRTAATLT